MTVGELLDRMTGVELMEWMAFFDIERTRESHSYISTDLEREAIAGLAKLKR